MAWSISDLFPTWGDSGEKPSANFQYAGGDQVNEKHLDYLWSSVGTLEDEVRSALSDIDSDGDGVVDKANAGASGFIFDGDVTLGGDLEATNGETIWDESNTYIPTLRLEADSDNDGLIEAFDESLIKDGGSREVDAAELGGSSGVDGNVLKTDGTSATWGPAEFKAGVPRYGDGRDGSITDSSNQTRSGLIQATDYTLQSGNTVTVDSTDGVFVIVAQNSIEINGTIDATGGGANGGSAATTQENSGNSGGKGFLLQRGAGGAGGSGGGNAAAGGDGGNGDLRLIKKVDQLPINRSIFSQLDDLVQTGVGAGGGGGAQGAYSENSGDGSNGSPPGGAGGGGGDPNADPDSRGAGGDGGAGGGAVILVAPNITVGGTIRASGEDGQDGGDLVAGGGGGGGGAGGLVYLLTESLAENSPTYDVSGGAGGLGGNGSGANGGDGATGATGEVLKLSV